MTRLDYLIDAYRKISTTQSDPEIMALLSALFKNIKFTDNLMTGIPLPNRSIRSLVLLNHWSMPSGIKLKVPDTDIIFSKAIDWPNAFVLKEEFHELTVFAKSSVFDDQSFALLVTPIHSIPGYQGVVINRLLKKDAPVICGEDQIISYQERSLYFAVMNLAFYHLHQLNPVPFLREGVLTPREKEVLSLCALGYTSLQTAELLGNKERTVISHLQNASKKLSVSNRTECVIEAIRYRQIGPGAGQGFYQIENELYPAKALELVR